MSEGKCLEKKSGTGSPGDVGGKSGESPRRGESGSRRSK